MTRRTFNIDIGRYVKPAAIFSSLITLLSMVVIAVVGLHYGVDFLGGVKMQYHFSEPVTEGAIASEVEKAIGEVPQVIRFGEPSENRYMIQISLKDGVDPRELSGKVAAGLEAAYGKDKITLEQEESVGPKAGKDMRNRGIAAIIIAMALVVVYLAYRFDMFFAPGAIVALIHDVSIPLAIFALLGKEFNLPIVAALLTIVGYSLNDTIIIYDRIRENERLMDASNFREIVYKSLNSTLSRTLVTSLTVFIVVLVLFLEGGGVIHDFAFTFMIGVVVGTYSSIFVASPVYIFLKGRKGFDAVEARKAK